MVIDRVDPERVAVVSYSDQKSALGIKCIMASQGYKLLSSEFTGHVENSSARGSRLECVLIDTSGVNITQHHAEISVCPGSTHAFGCYD